MECTKEEALEKIKELEEYVENLGKPLSLNMELSYYPERFERLIEDGWEQVTKSNGLSYGNVIVINSSWNRGAITDKVYHVEFDGEYHEIIRKISNN